MNIYKKTHEQKFNEPVKGRTLGLSRDEIIENLEPSSTFIHNGLFLYSIDPEWKEVVFCIILADSSLAELVYSIQDKKILSVASSSNQMERRLLENYEAHLDELSKLTLLIHAEDKEA